MKSARRRPSAPLGASLVVLSSVFYASYGIWTRLMGNFFGGYTAAALRGVLVVAILWPIGLAYHQFKPVDWRRHGKYVLGLMATSCLIWGPLYYAILHAGIGISLTINYATLVLGMFFFGWLLAGERFTRDKWLASALGLVGLWLIFTPSVGGLGWRALLAAALSGTMISLNLLFIKLFPYNTTQTTVVNWGTGVIANLLMAVVVREDVPAVGWHAAWGYIVLFALASVGSSWLYTKGLKLIEAGAAGILGLLEIVFAVVFGAIFFKEHIGAEALIGIVVVIMAAAVPYVKDYNSRRGTLDEPAA